MPVASSVHGAQAPGPGEFWPKSRLQARSPSSQQWTVGRLSPRKETVDAGIAFSKEKCGCAHMELKREQRRALTEVLGRKDSVVVLPTGYGKSLIYLLLPFADLFVRRDAGMTAVMENSVVLVVEPLTSLVEDQIKRATAMNLRPTSIYIYIYLDISNYGKRAAVTTLCP